MDIILSNICSLHMDTYVLTSFIWKCNDFTKKRPRVIANEKEAIHNNLEWCKYLQVHLLLYQ